MIEIKNKNGSKTKVELKKLDLSYIDKIMKLQEEVVEGLENKEVYYSSSKEEFEKIIKELGEIIGYVTLDNELISLGVYCKYGLDKENYGYDIDLKGDELLKVSHIESTIVKKEYRGNNLQKAMCLKLEEIGKNMKYIWLHEVSSMATASPYNPYSVNTFKSLGYEIVKDKIKYSGLRRYVFMKNI